MANEFGRFFLQDQPRAAFFNAIAPFSSSPLRERFFQEQFDPVFGQFLGHLGGLAQRGALDPFNLPQFGQFVQDFDFNRLFRQAPRFRRGVASQFSNPRTRFLFGF